MEFLNICMITAFVGAFITIFGLFSCGMGDEDTATMVMTLVGFTACVLGGTTALYFWLWTSTSHGLSASFIGAGVITALVSLIVFLSRRSQRRYEENYGTRSHDLNYSDNNPFLDNIDEPIVPDFSTSFTEGDVFPDYYSKMNMPKKMSERKMSYSEFSPHANNSI